jgi:branched-chain amino acid transport system substrate-binding protein
MRSVTMVGHLVLVAILTLACAADPRVGVLRPLTGEARAYGNAVDRGIRLAVTDATERNLLPEGFATLDVDTGSDPTRAVRELKRLVEQSGVRLFVGGVTADEAAALVPEINKARVVCLSPSSPGSGLSRKSRYLYRLYPGDELEGRTAARHLYDEMGVRRLLVYTDDSALTRDIETRFRQHFQLTLQGVIADTVHLDVPHWRKNSVDALSIHEPQAVYVVGHAGRILDVLRHLEEHGFDGVRCTTSTVFVGNVLAEAGSAAEGVTFPVSAFDLSSEREPMCGFVHRYCERFGHRPDIFAAHGYDAMKVAIHALSTASALYTPEIAKSLSFNLRDFAGVTGVIAFDEHGEVRHYPVMHCVSGGEVVSCRRLHEQRLERARRMLEQFRPTRAGEPRVQGAVTV